MPMIEKIPLLAMKALAVFDRQTSTMTKVSQDLGVSVVAISVAIRRTEKLLGHALIRPAGGGFSVTTWGAALVAHWRRIEVSQEELRADFSGLSEDNIAA